ncbi:MAG: hypothetical protein LBN03_00620, partial [Bifidobacteriaceae bacterium]|jgi:hypothetical protein|nr:hypothetical protein [Bifidobacteriaceae bacterium]
VTSEHHKWSEIINIYQNVINLKVKYTSLEMFLQKIYSHGVYQVNYDRAFDRILDNSKILKATSLTQNDFIKLQHGLTQEINEFIKHPEYQYINEDLNNKMDVFTESFLKKIKPRTRIIKLKNKIHNTFNKN